MVFFFQISVFFSDVQSNLAHCVCVCVCVCFYVCVCVCVCVGGWVGGG